jgi:hypothetical protein
MFSTLDSVSYVFDSSNSTVLYTTNHKSLSSGYISDPKHFHVNNCNIKILQPHGSALPATISDVHKKS